MASVAFFSFFSLFASFSPLRRKIAQKVRIFVAQNHTTMSTPTKENTLYLPIKQVYFDQIIAGTKKEEYREVTPTTYKKYLDCDEYGEPYYDDEVLTEEDMDFYGGDLLMACKDGKFPFFFRDDIEFLSLAVGYNKKRDTAIVEVTDITAEIAEMEKGKTRFNITEDGKPDFTPDGKFCFWQAVFHLGKVVELHRKDE